MKKPTTLIFDVNETLLDLAPLKTSIGAALGGREDLLPLWFTTMLQYSLVDTLVGDYRPFAQVGVGALMMLAEKQGIEMTREQAEAAVMGPFTQLPAHPDVKPALKRLADAGFKLVTLTNSALAGIKAQLEFAGLTDDFERAISTEEVQAFKPDLRTYNYACETLGVAEGDTLMIAAHAWDLAGAASAGMQTAFIKRPGAVLYPNIKRPDHVVDDLGALADALIG